MDSITIRLAQTEDVCTITAITRAAYSKWVPLLGWEPIPMKVDYALAIQTHRFDLLCDGDVVTGLIAVAQFADRGACNLNNSAGIRGR
jgi:hypothetical protein